ncbi:bacillithiol biosynthesis deacetylase BshB1 [Balneola vulgaris]|uniref:bacillithiol biosynthesis deacetylase BshB1 n=1 Tax=Balneola vulgaris TaxID=287535 RepID=UPI00036DAD93|nr:bacillithiol biosynthesis deacetylase BshB1 [Balneola vulgaris]
MKLDVLVFAAHPDDAELNIGGTISSLSSEGKKVGVVDLTQGEMGTRGSVEIRAKEAAKASEILGLSYRKNLNLGDSILENTRTNQLKVIEVVRETQPEVCLIGAPFDRHPDHIKATNLLIDSLFYSGLKNIETSSQSPWRPSHILHYMQDRPIEYDFIYDISGFWQQKKESILAFATQFNVHNEGDEPATYISSEDYFKQVEARARYFGHLGGFEYGEPFKYYNGPVPLNNFDVFLGSKVKR